MQSLHFEVWLVACGSEYNQTSIIMNRQEFEELELQVTKRAAVEVVPSTDRCVIQPITTGVENVPLTEQYQTRVGSHQF